MVNLASPTSTTDPNTPGRPAGYSGGLESSDSDVDSYSDDFEEVPEGTRNGPDSERGSEEPQAGAGRRLEPKMSLALSRAGSINVKASAASGGAESGRGSGEEMPLSGGMKQTLLDKHGPMLEPYTERVVAFVRENRGRLGEAALSERLMAMVPKEKHSALFNVFLALHADGA